ncbi:MAG: hypothetical protein P4L16_07765 [Chlamydiales bacterium]|nr:hypothetical protein [Chlamydiales bacterium]
MSITPTSSPSGGPGWLRSATETSKDNERIYTYTINVKGKDNERLVTVQIVENANLTSEQLAARQLGHFVLLKSMHQLGKKDIDTASSQDPFKVGREIELITDNKSLDKSTKAGLLFKPATEELNTSAFFYKNKEHSPTGSIESAIVPENKANVFLQTSFVFIDPTKITHVSSQTVLQRCEEIRKRHFSEKQALNLTPPPSSAPTPTPPSPTSHETPITASIIPSPSKPPPPPTESEEDEEDTDGVTEPKYKDS